MITVRSLWVWFSTAILILAWLPAMGLVWLFDRDPAKYRTGRLFRRLGSVMTRANTAWKLEIEGDLPADPRNPYVVVCNHQSNADIPVISRLPWDMKWVGKAHLFDLPIVGWMMRLARDIPVNRKDKASRANVLVLARGILAKKCSVMFFPEGTRSRDGRVGRFADGPFRLAIDEQVPVLPLALDGSSDALPKSSWKFGGRSTIRLKVLAPVPTAGLAGDDTAALRTRVRAAIVEQIGAWRGVAPEAVSADELPSSPRSRA